MSTIHIHLKKGGLAMLCFLIFKISFAQTGGLQGVVLNATDNTTLSGVTVTLLETGATTFTNEFGVYKFSQLLIGDITVQISSIGYEITTLLVQIIPGETVSPVSKINSAPITLNDVTISANRAHEQQTISGVDMHLRPTNNAQDLLRLVPGLIIAQHAGGGKAEQIFLRGFDIDHGTDLSVNVDGLPVNMVSHAHGQGYADLHFVIPETVQSFSFMKGPYTTEYGDFATAGSINFNTINNPEHNLLKLSFGEFKTARTLFLLKAPGQPNKMQSAYLAAEYQVTDGPFESPQNFNRLNVFAKYRTLLNGKNLFSLTASTFSSKWNASGQIPERAVEMGLINRFGAIDSNEGGNTARSTANLKLVNTLSTNRQIAHQLYFSNYQFELFSNFTFFLVDTVNGDKIKQKENRNLFGYNITYSNESSLFNKNSRFDLGMGFRADLIHKNELSHVAESEQILERLAYGNIHQTNAFVFADETLSLTPSFTINGILRIDGFNFAYENLLDTISGYKIVADAIVTYKLNFDYNVSKNVAVYLYTGKGFHSNDTRVVVAQNALQTLPAAYGADLGGRLKCWDKLLLNPAVWMLYLEQEFVYVGDAAIVEPSGKSLRKGLDISARYEMNKWLFVDVDFNYTFARALNEAAGENYIPLAASITSIGGLNVRTEKGWNGSLRYRYIGDRPANETASVIAKGYFVNDLVINYTQSKYEIGVEIQNLFNVEWNEAQFDTESRLQVEAFPTSELHFTPGVPFLLKLNGSIFF